MHVRLIDFHSAMVATLLVSLAQRAAGQSFKETGVSVVRAVQLGDLPIPLNGEVTFSSIQRALGPATQLTAKDHHGTDRLCYRIALSGQRATLFLESGGLGGADRGIMGFDLRIGDPPPDTASKCSLVSSDHTRASTDNGLWIGMSVDSLARVMGKPTKRQLNELTFEYLRYYPAGPDSPCRNKTTSCTPVGTLRVTIANSKVTALAAWFANVH